MIDMGHGQYFVYSSKSSPFEECLSSFSKPQLHFQKIETARILLSINLNFGCSSYPLISPKIKVQVSYLGVSENRLNPIVANGFADHYPVMKNGYSLSLGINSPNIFRSKPIYSGFSHIFPMIFPYFPIFFPYFSNQSVDPVINRGPRHFPSHPCASRLHGT